MLQTIFLIYMLLINLAGFAIMGIDKRKAQKGLYRIPEKTLFLVSLIGGSLGTYIGMEYFRHKTKHKKFTLGMPAILLFHGVLLLYAAKTLSL